MENHGGGGAPPLITSFKAGGIARLHQNPLSKRRRDRGRSGCQLAIAGRIQAEVAKWQPQLASAVDERRLWTQSETNSETGGVTLSGTE